MQIHKLFDKEIERRINPAVVVSEMEEYFVNQEIDEYVFTSGVTTNVHKFLNAIANKKEGKTGVWISGYYGSGKSHFIKYLFYALSEKYRDQAFSNFQNAAGELDPLNTDGITPSSVGLLQKKLDQLNVDEIIFNIDAVADNDEESNRITRVLLNQLNNHRGFNDSNIALALYLEKPLAKSGNLEAFKKKIKDEFNENWEGNQLRFARMYLDKVIGIFQEFDSNVDKDSLKYTIKDRNQDYSIDFFIDELQDHLSDKDDDYRLLFLMDEVSQYIGSNTSLLLNLQTIVEEIGSKIGPKVWVVCTAQQDLSNLINNTDSKTEDFGKILGRFETMISLESQDAAFITKKRILDKKSDGIAELNGYYKDHKGAIENQFVFDHDLYENYGNREDFTLTYPFIPYQFRLISDVFESFSNVGYVGEGVKNTERAILGITHFTANLCKDQEVGYFVPFDLFFNEQLEKNMTQVARSILDRAYHINDVKSDPFAGRVVNVLFMISNLGESQSVNFPSNIENISLLLMDSVETGKSDMQNKAQTVLDALVAKNIIQVSEGIYRFLKEDEIEVAQLIKSTSVTGEDKLKYIYDDIIQKLISPKPSVTFGNKTFKVAVKIDDKEIFPKGDFGLRFSIFDTESLENISHNIPANDILIGISEWLNNEQDLKSKILDYIRTQKYIRDHSKDAKGTRHETLKSFRENNVLLLNEIKLRFDKLFATTSICSKNRVIESSNFSGATPALRYDNMLTKHWEEVYKKHGMSNNYATSNAELITNSKSGAQITAGGLAPAEEELTNKLNLMGDGPLVSEVIKAFDKPPYGWKDLSTLDILVKLGKLNHRRFEWRNEEIDVVTFADKALNSRERDALTIHSEKVHSQEEVDAFKACVDEIFPEGLISPKALDFKETVESFKSGIQPFLTELNELKTNFEDFPFAHHSRTLHSTLKDIYQKNPEALVESVHSQKDHLKEARDLNMLLKEFTEVQIDNYKRIADFVHQNKSNFNSLEDDLQAKSKELEQYLQIDREPWEKFPQMNKAYKEIMAAIKSQLDDLKTKVVENYEKVFEDIDEHKKEIGLEEANITTDGDHFLGKLKKQNDIAQLKIAQLESTNIRSENLKKLDDFKQEKEAKKTGKAYVASTEVSIVAEMPPTTISTPEELEAYISKLRERLMVKLSKNQKIFIN